MLISVSLTCAAKCWRRLDGQLMTEAWCVTAALMRITVLSPKKFGCMPCRILWHDAGYPWLE